jgi:hypothetical protein
VKVGVFVRDKQAVKEAGATKPTPRAHHTTGTKTQAFRLDHGYSH